MKLTKKELYRIGEWYNFCLMNNKDLIQIDDESIYDKIQDIIEKPTKPTKYFPIETAPIGTVIVCWSTINEWTIHHFQDQEELRDFLRGNSHYTHWRPIPKRPV